MRRKACISADVRVSLWRTGVSCFEVRVSLCSVFMLPRFMFRLLPRAHFMPKVGAFALESIAFVGFTLDRLVTLTPVLACWCGSPFKLTLKFDTLPSALPLAVAAEAHFWLRQPKVAVEATLLLYW